MPPREWKMRIEDILEAVGRIERYTRGMDLDAFRADDKTLDAVIRNVTVIGEAARHVPPEIAGKYPDIPWTEMREIRNVVVHEYFGVSESILWETIQDDLPPLVPLLRKILQEGESSGPE